MAGEAPPLAGVRMVEWAEGLAGSFAGFLLAALGADVVTIEAAGARRTSAASVLQRGKRSVDAVCWDACVRGADVTLTDEAGPAVEAGDGLIACRVTAWGDAGAPRVLPPEEPLIAAMTGVQAMQWSWAGRPVWLVTPMLSYMTGMLAALGVVGARRVDRLHGVGAAVQRPHDQTVGVQTQQRLQPAPLQGLFGLGAPLGGSWIGKGGAHPPPYAARSDPASSRAA